MADAVFHSDGRGLLTVSGGVLRAWDMKDLDAVLPTLHGTEPIENARYDSTQTLILASGGNTVQLFRSDTGEPATHPFRHDGRVTDARYDPRQERLIVATERGVVYFWDLRLDHRPAEQLAHEAELLAGRRLRDGVEQTAIPIKSNRRGSNGEDLVSRISEATRMLRLKPSTSSNGCECSVKPSSSPETTAAPSGSN